MYVCVYIYIYIDLTRFRLLSVDGSHTEAAAADLRLADATLADGGI